jgi:hypothetical protein
MCNYIDIKIDRIAIDTLLNQNGYSVASTSINGVGQRNIIISDREGKSVVLEIYMKKTGGTTLVTRKNKDNIGESICALIKEKLSFFNVDNVNLSHNVEELDFNTLLQNISKEFGAELVDIRDIMGGKQYKLSSQRDGNLTFKYFTRRKNLQIQGKALKHFSFIYKKLIDLGYNINKSIDVIKELDLANSNDLLEEYLPCVGNKLSSDVQNIAVSSLELMKVNANFSDGSIVLFPMMRTLEHIMRTILSNNDIEYTRQRGFDMFGTESDGTKVFNQDSKNMDSVCKELLGKCYTFYYKHRHSMFHLSDDITEIRTIGIEEAKELTLECINLIEEIGNDFY